MLTRLLRASLPAVLVGTLGVPVAHADIFTWVDASGTINVSNLPPPDGVEVTRITHENPPSSARDEAARAAAHQAEVLALEERVGQLENELVAATRQPPTLVVYPPMPAPPVTQYITEFSSPVSQYGYGAGYAPMGGCDSTWVDCGAWWAPGFYPAAVVVLGRSNFRHAHGMHDGGHFAAHQPARPPDHLRRG